MHPLHTLADQLYPLLFATFLAAVVGWKGMEMLLVGISIERNGFKGWNPGPNASNEERGRYIFARKVAPPVQIVTGGLMLEAFVIVTVFCLHRMWITASPFF